MASAGASGNSTLTPSCNRLLQRKWDEKRLQAHKERVGHGIDRELNLYNVHWIS